MQWLLKKIIGTKTDRDLKKLAPLVARINALEEEYQSLTDDALRAKTEEFKERVAAWVAAPAQRERLEVLRQALYAAIDDKEKRKVRRQLMEVYHGMLDPLLPEAFAAVKNACRRLKGKTIDVCGHPLVWDMIPFDVQLVGGIVLHQGKIAEMATGEGKTLVATLPVYLNALAGKNVHVVTVNDYLARRDSAWMGAVYEFLGLSVGCIQNAMNPTERRAEYARDITYGTNSEFGFDYLRDKGMAMRPAEQVQRVYFYAIVDEIDSILIDEARTPLIISGPAPQSTHQYHELKAPVERLVRRQRELCNRLVADARKLIDEEQFEEAQLLLYQVNQGMPKNKQLLHMLEDPAARRLLEKIDAAMLTDMRKEQARALREELYFTIDEKGNDATLTEKGCAALSPDDPEAYVLPDLATELAEMENREGDPDELIKRRQQLQDEFAVKSERIHNVDQLIRAYCVYERDVQYVVQNNQVVIVDEFTGRLMPGRRWSDGLHQAVEAKEGVTIERETQTLATITIQNYFRMYDKLGGMTGTAETEADEFHEIYGLDVVVIPTNRPVRRVDNNDLVYKTQREKFNAILQEIEECHGRRQPVLVGTASVDTSEVLSRMLRRRGLPHNVLNAKNHEREAEIVARAGQPGAVTIATNMAGRGTDIKLGPGVVTFDRSLIESGLRLQDRINSQTMLAALDENPQGLHVIGSERHEARRIDRQLRGRCARQGDPGSSRFYVSLEDDLMRLFGSERVANVMGRLGLEEGQMLEHPLLNRSIGTAQRRVEQQNFSIRKRTLEYDDVVNKQREVIYGFRSEIVAAEEVRPHLWDIIEEVVAGRIEPALEESGEDALAGILEWVNLTFPLGLKAADLPSQAQGADALVEAVCERVRKAYELKASLEQAEALTAMERFIVLHAIDTHWQEFLRSMDGLRQGVGLRAYGQRDPLIEYKHEAYQMFSDLMVRIKEDIVQRLFRSATSMESMNRFLRVVPQRYVHDEVNMLGGGRGAQPPPGANEALRSALDERREPVRRSGEKVGRNDPCPCGSGKKYKKCCGRQPAAHA